MRCTDVLGKRVLVVRPDWAGELEGPLESNSLTDVRVDSRPVCYHRSVKSGTKSPWLWISAQGFGAYKQIREVFVFAWSLPESLVPLASFPATASPLMVLKRTHVSLEVT